MRNPILSTELRELIEKKDTAALKKFCMTGHPAAIAEILADLEPQEVWEVLNHADLSIKSDIFSHLDIELQAEIIDHLRRSEIVWLITEMSPDDRANLFKRIPEDKREAILPALAQAEREDIRRLTSYEEGMAGAVMTSDYAVLPPSLTAAQALEKLREVAPDKETIYYAYVVDENRKLLGSVSLKDLIVARKDEKIEKIMDTDTIYAKVDDDQEEAARKIQKYDIIALPVVNSEGALVGIITHDDAIDIISQEHTEDMEKLMAIAGTHEAGAYLRTPSWVHFKNRSYWVIGLAILGLVSGTIIHSFEDTLMQLLILVIYMPMIANTGGNTGSQSATVVIRALTLKEIQPKDILKVFFKEFKISIMLSAVLGIISWSKVMFLSSKADIPIRFSLHKIGLVIAIALSIQVVTATLIGAFLPLAAAKLKLDPAIVASPALTTFVDITGLLIYFTTAKLLLGI